MNDILNLKLERLWLNENYTIGRLFVDGKYFCNTLEDKVRDLTKEKKIAGHTAIPYGRYKVEVTFSKRFMRYLPLLLEVPQFTGIRIHAGNTSSDTEGCILLGENKIKGQLVNSKFYVDRLMEILKEHQGETYIDVV